MTRPVPPAPRRKSMPRMARGPEGAAEAERGATGEPAAPLEAAAAAAGEAAAPPMSSDDVVAGHARRVRQQAIEVEHEARAARGFRGEHGIDATRANVDAARRQRERRVREIQRDARRIVDGERDRLGGRRRVMQRELQLLTGEVLHVDRFELVRRALRVRGLAGEGRRRRRRRATTESRRPTDGW